MTSQKSDVLDAMARLLAGAPARTSGDRTATNLAREAGISRTELYRSHRSLVIEFLAANPEVVRAGGWKAVSGERLRDAEERCARLREEVKILTRERDKLSSIVVALDAEVAGLRGALEDARGVSHIETWRARD